MEPYGYKTKEVQQKLVNFVIGLEQIIDANEDAEERLNIRLLTWRETDEW
jgi:hypothetical protein